MATLPADEHRDHRALRPASLVDERRTALDPRRARSARQDALLLLRPAVRHPAQGPGQRGHRLRAVGGVPVQSRHAVPQGREALPAGLASRSPAHGAAPRHIRQRRLQRLALCGGHVAGGRRDRSPAEGAWPGRHRRAQRREPDDREDVPARQVRARVPEDAVHRLQRPALHGERRRGEQEGVRHRPHDQSVVRHDRHRGDLGRRLERGRVLADHDQLHLAGARARRAGHRAGSAHHADRPHLRPLPAGEAGTRRRALRRRAAADDRARLARSRVHRAAHDGLRAGRRLLPSVDPRPHGGGHRRAPNARSSRPRNGGARRRPASSSTRAASSITRTACRTRSARSTSCSPRDASGSPRAATARSSARPTARAGASTARSATSFPAGATSPIRSTAATSPACGASRSATCRPRRRCVRDVPQDRRGRDQGAAVDLLQPEGVAARQHVRHALPREARVLRRHRLLPERHRPSRRHRACRAACRRRTRAR